MRQLLPILFLVVFLTLIAMANIYLARRFAFYFDLKSPRYLYLTFGLITLYFIAAIIAFTNAESTFANRAYSLASILMGFMLYLLLSVATIHLVSVFVKISPVILGAGSLTLAVLVTIFGIWNATTRRITEVDIPISGLKKEVTAIHLSDIHLGHFWGPRTLQKIVDLTNAQNPNVVFITGDLFDGKIRLKSSSLVPLKNLNAPVYFVEGNHDGYSGVAEIKQKLREIGVTVLENEVTHFGELQIIGLDHMRADDGSAPMHGTGKKPSLKSTLDQLNIFDGPPTILLHHSPDGMEFANQHGIDLYLAGHTHNGQLFPFNFVVGMVYKYNKGLHNYKGTWIYTSQGVGTFGPPMRVGTKSEIVLLHLKPE
jgi:predicted MPP superfamily phosphohydrolase